MFLLSSAGSGFSAGNDLHEFLTDPPTGEDFPALRFVRALAGLAVPLVAAVHGRVVGVGATALPHCDVVVADTTARLSYPFVALGLAPEAGSSLLLPRAIGHLRAADLILLGETIGAHRAHELGLVSRVVEEGTHLEAAREFTARLGRCASVLDQAADRDGSDVAGRRNGLC